MDLILDEKNRKRLSFYSQLTDKSLINEWLTPEQKYANYVNYQTVKIIDAALHVFCLLTQNRNASLKTWHKCFFLKIRIKYSTVHVPYKTETNRIDVFFVVIIIIVINKRINIMMHGMLFLRFSEFVPLIDREHWYGLWLYWDGGVLWS